MKRTAVVAFLAIALVMMLGGAAYANFGPHGGYISDTDSCAGCHRAHTSASPVEWKDSFDTTHTALLVGTAQTMEEFCYACHGDSAPGASTNVQSGIFDSGPSAPGNVTVPGLNSGVVTAYQTASTFGATLNGGGFDRLGGVGHSTSMHQMEKNAATAPMWGAGSSAPAGTNLTCTDCHDPHGSSNYRLLKDKVNGHTVGGYDNAGNPDPYVVSMETGYPTTNTVNPGWLKHKAGQDQMAQYRPNYTTALYGFDINRSNAGKSMSAWCAACHEQYNVTASNYDYGSYEQDPNNAAFQVGDKLRHRHVVDVSLGAGVGPARALAEQVVTDTLIPLEQRLNSPNPQGQTDFDDNMGCLTCHRAHGTDVTMSGWADASLVSTNGVFWLPQRNGATPKGGVNPGFTSALLRVKDRGVCERCHNK